MHHDDAYTSECDWTDETTNNRERNPMHVVFFDLETGGTDHRKHPIIQIAAAAVDEQLNVVETFERKLAFDLATADPVALEINSYDAKRWQAEAISPLLACSDFARFLKPYSDVPMVSKRTGRAYAVARLAGHNAAGFDMPFLQAIFQATGQFLPADMRVLDTLQRAMWHFHESKQIVTPADMKLSTLANYFGVAADGAHDALADVRMNVAIYKALLAAK